MGTPRHRVVWRNWPALIGITAAASAALVVFGSVGVGATGSKIALIPGDPVTAAEGNVVERVVAQFTDANNVVPSINAVLQPKVAACNDADTYTASINWGDGGTATTGAVSCSGQDTWQVIGSYTYKDSGSFNITVTVNDSDGDSATGQTDTAAITDQELAAVSAANVKGTEAGKVKVTAIFKDSNPAFSSDESVDPGLSATIDWGDGTTSKADKIAWDDSNESNVRVTGSHLYDANTGESSYTIKVTLTDDGSDGSAMTTSHATIGDAKLTAGDAKSFAGTVAQASTPVVASFTDAAGAQAKVADFTAAINWGDGTSSAGTLTQTGAGAFDVSGTHTYTTAGTKALTIAVTDEEGQTLSMTATATVAAAPIVLPATGQPHPTQPGLPLIPAALLILGVASLAVVGRVLAKMPR
jgi:hypothetical protein